MQPNRPNHYGAIEGILYKGTRHPSYKSPEKQISFQVNLVNTQAFYWVWAFSIGYHLFWYLEHFK